MTIQSKLGLALRKKFKSPREALRALGLDENLGGDDEVDPYANVRKLLRERGLSNEDVGRTVEIARAGWKATDHLPRNGIGAMDEARRATISRELNEKFGLDRIATVGAPLSLAMDRRSGGLSRAETDRLNRMFPGIERIGVG